MEKINGGHQMVARCIWSKKKKEKKKKRKNQKKTKTN
jgi:hypothetical protein